MEGNFSRAVVACIMEINDKLDDPGKVASMVTYCKLRKGDTFTEKDGEECTDFLSLFKKLSELDIIRCDDISFVKDMLEDNRRKDLAKELWKAYNNEGASQSDFGDGGIPNQRNQERQRQGNEGSQAYQGAQNSNSVVVIGDNNTVVKDCVVNVKT